MLIRPRQLTDDAELLAIWHRAVEATHGFLSAADIQRLHRQQADCSLEQIGDFPFWFDSLHNSSVEAAVFAVTDGEGQPRRYDVEYDSGIVNIIDVETLKLIGDIPFLPTGFRPEQVTPVDLVITADGRYINKSRT